MAQVIIFTGMLSGYTTLSTRPIGAYQVANQLRKNGYTVQVINYFPQLLGAGGISLILKCLDKFVSADTLWVGFSTTFLSDIYSSNTPKPLLPDEESDTIKKFVRARSPGCRFVVGGPGAYLHNSGSLIDTYIEGYADTSVIEFTKWCEGKNPFFTFNDCGSYITVNHDVKAANFNFTEDKFEWHNSDGIFAGEVLPIELSRGCIFKCGFCSYPLNGKKKLDYIKHARIIRDELLSNYEKYKTTNYVFLDDTHNDSVEKLEILHDEVFSQLPFKINYACFLRLDLLAAHPHTIELLKNSGLKIAFFGIESLNHLSNKSIGKGITEEKIVQTTNLIHESWKGDIITYGSVIFGLPHDSPDTIHNWMSVLTSDRVKLDYIHIHPLSLDSKMQEYPWAGDFIKNPAEYGYKLEGSEWINNTGMSQKTATILAEEYKIKLRQIRKWPRVHWSDLLDMLASVPNWPTLKQILNNNVGTPYVENHKAKIRASIENYAKQLIK